MRIRCARIKGKAALLAILRRINSPVLLQLLLDLYPKAIKVNVLGIDPGTFAPTKPCKRAKPNYDRILHPI